jgi:hypothetical protein
MGHMLFHLGFEGDLYTWRNNSKHAESYICERLDRATTNSEWCTMFPNFCVVNGEYYHSDHRPLIVHLDDEGVGRSFGTRGPFRFEARWLQEEG